jgi:hypothetical protein
MSNADALACSATRSNRYVVVVARLDENAAMQPNNSTRLALACDHPVQLHKDLADIIL